MRAAIKVPLSIAGVFLGGLTTAYQANPDGDWLKWTMGGLAPVAGYLVGFWQLNPAIRKKSARA